MKTLGLVLRSVFFQLALLNAVFVALVLFSDLKVWWLALAGVLFNCLAGVAVAAHFKPLRKARISDSYEHSFDSTLQIANETLPYLRRGLNVETATKTAEIIQKISDVDAVAITDTKRVLAYIGAGSDHHKAGGPILTLVTKGVIKSGRTAVVASREGLNCPHKDCPLEAAVVAPLKCKSKVLGTVKLYQTKEKGPLSSGVIKLAIGIAQLLSVQMELAELDRQVQLSTRAELDALHAQINPHFLFNTLNTIAMFSRTEPETARRLLIRLASFFRQSLKRHGHFKTFREEMEYVNTYISLEQARFAEKIHVAADIDESLMDYQVPVLSIQPLVENAIKHGILPKNGQGTVQIEAREEYNDIVITVSDDGVGVPEEKLAKILTPGFGSGNGVGMSNVNERLKSLFGVEYGLCISSEEGKGTSVSFKVPMMCPVSVADKEEEG